MFSKTQPQLHYMVEYSQMKAQTPIPILPPIHQHHSLPHTKPNPMAPPSPNLIYFDAIYLAIGLLSPFWGGFVGATIGACSDGIFKSLSLGPKSALGAIAPQPCRLTKRIMACFDGLWRGFQTLKEFVGGCF